MYDNSTLNIKPLHIDADGRAYLRLGNIEEGTKIAYLHEIITDIVHGAAPISLRNSSEASTQTDVSTLKDDYLPPDPQQFNIPLTNACLPTFRNTQNASSFRGRVRTHRHHQASIRSYLHHPYN